jgi:hypothetical protein
MEEIVLKNGVKMLVDDRTKVLTGDLYMVHFEFTTVVDLEEHDGELKGYFPDGRARMTRELKKPAVHERDLEAVKASMRDSFLATNLPYMEKPRFPKRFKAKLLKDFKDEEDKKKKRHG